MDSAFQTAMKSGVRQMVDSALGASITFPQPFEEIVVNAIWREGEAVERIYPSIHATVFIALEDFQIGERREPVVGDRIQRGSKLYEVREKTLNGVGGATLFVRFLQDV